MLCADRKAGAPLRCHSVDSVAQLHVPYVFPSESGGRADVRWLALAERSGGPGLLAAAVGAGSTLQASSKRGCLPACACMREPVSAAASTAKSLGAARSCWHLRTAPAGGAQPEAQQQAQQHAPLRVCAHAPVLFWEF